MTDAGFDGYRSALPFEDDAGSSDDRRLSLNSWALVGAHMCAAVPNFKVMEIDIDDAKWKDDIVTAPPVIENGDLISPKGPGWGAEINEEFVRAHPPTR